MYPLFHLPSQIVIIPITIILILIQLIQSHTFYLFIFCSHDISTTSFQSECHREEGFTVPRVFLSEDYKDAMVATANKSCKYLVGLGSTLRYGIERDQCGTLVLTGSPFFAEGISYILPRNSSITYALSRATLRLKTEDAISTILDFFDDDNNCIPEKPKSLSFQKLRWFFFLAFGACALVFVEMVFDRRRVPTSAVVADNTEAATTQTGDDDGSKELMKEGQKNNSDGGVDDGSSTIASRDVQ